MNKTDKYFGLSPRIARWKIDTPVENWLSRKADTSEFWKKLYVDYYRIFDKAYYNGGLKFIEQYLQWFGAELEGLSRDEVARDMIYCLHRFGLSFQDYWIYSLINKSLRERLSFVSDKLRYHYCDILNASNVEAMMSDKYLCYKAYKEFFKRDVLGCYSKEDLSEFLAFVEKHDYFIYKPLSSDSGKGIEIYNTADIITDEFFENCLRKGAFVVEELIEQGDEIAKMHNECINSFRVATFVIQDEVHILGVTWRIGVGNLFVDNAGAGGIYASVDPENGIVISDARNYRGEHYLFHPNSGLQIIGFNLPHWDEAKDLIKKIATKVKGTTLIAWDLAYSEKGWCMVEANDNGDWSLLQSNKKEGKKEELFKLMDRYFSEKNMDSVPQNVSD